MAKCSLLLLVAISLVVHVSARNIPGGSTRGLEDEKNVVSYGGVGGYGGVGNNGLPIGGVYGGVGTGADIGGVGGFGGIGGGFGTGTGGGLGGLGGGVGSGTGVGSGVLPFP